MKIFKKYWFPLALLSMFFIVVIHTLFKKTKTKSEIEENRNEGIAHVTKIFDNRSITRIYYTYKYANILFEKDELTNLNVNETIINKYYEIYISTKNPSKSLIQLDKEVADTNRIKAAGFDINITN